MSRKSWKELRGDLEALWSELEDQRFDLVWHNLSGLGMEIRGEPFGRAEILKWKGLNENNPPFDLDNRVTIGRLCMPLDDTREVFTLGTDVVTLPGGKCFEKCRKRFLKIASACGALLPVDLRGELEGYVFEHNRDPAAWWFACLFHLYGDRFEQINEGGITVLKAVSIRNVLLASLNAIDKLSDNGAEPEKQIDDSQGRVPQQMHSDPMIKLLSVFTNGVSDERIKNSADILQRKDLTANQKLMKINSITPIPPTASASQLGEMLGVSKTTVIKSEWWESNRKGQKDEKIEARRQAFQERSKRIREIERS